MATRSSSRPSSSAIGHSVAVAAIPSAATGIAASIQRRVRSAAIVDVTAPAPAIASGTRIGSR